MKGLDRHGIIKPIAINRYKGRENVIINGVAIIEMCRELSISIVDVIVYNVPLALEKEIHFLLNRSVSCTSEEVIHLLLGKEFDYYFDNIVEFDDEERAVLKKLPDSPKTKMADSLKTVISHVNSEERDMLNKAKAYFGCKKDSEVVIKLLRFFVNEKGGLL